MHLIRARIPLIYGDTTGESRDGYIFPKWGIAFVDECDDRGVKVVFDGKHIFSIAGWGPAANGGLVSFKVRLGCPDPEGCANWLGDHPEGANAAPEICQNRGLFQQLG